MKTEYQVSDHGCGKLSVQIFDTDTEPSKLLEDRAIVRDVDGYRVVGDQRYDRPQHATPEAAAKHYATLVHDSRANHHQPPAGGATEGDERC